MKITLRYLAMACLLLLVSSSCESKLTGSKLIQKSIEYHDPKGQWSETSRVFYFADFRPGKNSRQYQVFLDLRSSYFKYINTSESVVYEVKEDKCLSTNQESPECERALMLSNYYAYLWGLPMKLMDEGTKIDEAFEREDLKGISAFKVRVAYEKDIWYFYLHPENFQLLAYKFYKDEEKKVGEIIYLEGEIIVGNIKIPSERSWHRTEKEEFLGTDFLLRTENFNHSKPE